MIQEIKRQIRLKLLTKLRRQKEVERLKKSFKIQQKLFSLPEFIKAEVILFYLSFDGEVETHRMIEKAISLGKKVAVPLILRKEKKIKPSLIKSCGYGLEIGPYGIFQPQAKYRKNLPISKIDLIVVPAVAYDLGGRRLGRGSGYYDRLLNSLTHRIPTVGIAFDFQILDKVPTVASYDHSVERILYA